MIRGRSINIVKEVSALTVVSESLAIELDLLLAVAAGKAVESLKALALFLFLLALESFELASLAAETLAKAVLLIVYELLRKDLPGI